MGAGKCSTAYNKLFPEIFIWGKTEKCRMGVKWGKWRFCWRWGILGYASVLMIRSDKTEVQTWVKGEILQDRYKEQDSSDGWGNGMHGTRGQSGLWQQETLLTKPQAKGNTWEHKCKQNSRSARAMLEFQVINPDLLHEVLEAHLRVKRKQRWCPVFEDWGEVW